MIEGAELIVYDENGNNINVDLSQTQLLAVCKILGLKAENGILTCFSDKSLKIFMKKTIERFEL